MLMNVTTDLAIGDIDLLVNGLDLLAGSITARAMENNWRPSEMAMALQKAKLYDDLHAKFENRMK